MPPPDFWPDARRIPKDKLRLFVETVRGAREALGLSNADLCREVRGLIRAHNAVAGRTKVAVKAISEGWEFDEQGKYELDAMLKGTRKYIVGYLGWLCLRDEDAAKEFYRQVKLKFRPYPQEDAETLSLSETETFASWSSLINTYAKFERIEVLTLEEAGLALVDLADREPVARALHLEEPFCFRFDVPLAGHVLAFQRHRGNWYPLPMTDTALHLHTDAGKQVLPRQSETGLPVPLSENDEAGRYGFGFFVAEDERAAELSAQLLPGEVLPPHLIEAAANIVADLPAKHRAVYRINVAIAD